MFSRGMSPVQNIMGWSKGFRVYGVLRVASSDYMRRTSNCLSHVPLIAATM